MRRRTCIFSGHVQGVGFRFTTHQIAQRHAVTGTVRNLPDGRVEVIAEGEAAALDAFIADIRDRIGQFIRDVKSSEQPATGGFTSFAVKH